MNASVRAAAWLFCFASSLTAASAHADPVWVGDMETADLTQWEYLLNPEHISVVSSPVVQGAHAAQIQLTNDAVWSNGLKRVELHHSPGPGRTAEGAELYFAWSFYLPRALPVDPVQIIGYWESNNSYQGTMYFAVQGEHILFTTRKPDYVVQWDADNVVTAGTWHRIALHVRWSKDPGEGYVDVWYDGAQVVDHAAAQTLVDDNSHFTQVGLLRDAIEFADTPVIVIDDAVEGDSLADVHPEVGSGNGGAGAGGGASASVSVGPGAGGATGGGAGAPGALASATGAGGAGATNAAPSAGGDDGGCSCRATSSLGSRREALCAVVAALAAAGLGVRRRGGRQPAPGCSV